MKTKIKKLIKIVIRFMVGIASRSRIGWYLINQVLNTIMERVDEVSHNNLKLKFSAPNSLCDWRAKTFSIKEPETLEWIDSIPKESVLWDVGANIGLYSVYAAKKRNCKIWAFEPSVFNLELLARNIYINGITKQVCIVPIALSDRLGSNLMRMTTTEWGGALSSFGEDFGWDGQKIQEVFEFQTIGINMENAVNDLEIPNPDYIKIDVDGIEHFILRGGAAVLNDVKGILIEVNDDFHEHAKECERLLNEAGLVLKEKRVSEMIANSVAGTSFQNTYNQIWIRQ